MYRPTLEPHLAPHPPKRILALDGGGVRGILTLGYLARIESMLRSRYGDPNLRLCDYFDLIGHGRTFRLLRQRNDLSALTDSPAVVASALR